ncbi:hypothetical protein H4R19_001070 [Coemansia spiralis]|nr:hypothetical protein H4R19_001070 [Coemansia spiralis]
MATPLFSQQPRRGGGAGHHGTSNGSVPGALVEFKAGRLFRDGQTNWVRPDPRRGVCFARKEDDGLLRFCWKERHASISGVEEELIVFPGDVYLEKVQQSGGRVYVLKFRSSSQRVFFWLQEADADGDRALIHHVNIILGDCSSGGDEDEDEEDDEEDEEARQAGARLPSLVQRHGSREAELLSRHREQSALAQENPALDSSTQMAAQVGGVPGASMRRASQQYPGGDVESMGGNGSRVGGLSSSQLGGLRQLLSSIRVPEGYRGGQRSAGEEPIQLSDVLTPGNLQAVLNDPQLRSSLFPTLPDDIPHTQQALNEVIRSPQFQQALDSLSYVLESGQMAPLVAQLGLEPSAGTSVHAFLAAIEKQLHKESDTDNDDDTHME